MSRSLVFILERFGSSKIMLSASIPNGVDREASRFPLRKDGGMLQKVDGVWSAIRLCIGACIGYFALVKVENEKDEVDRRRQWVLRHCAWH